MNIIKISKKDKDNYNLKTFSLHETKRSIADSLKQQILDYKHFENMLLILMHKCQENKDYEILELLKNKVIMKAISQKTKGKEKTQENIQKVNSYFSNNELFQNMIDFSKSNLNGHNVSMLVERVKKDWNNSKKKRDEYFKNTSNFKGVPHFPKAKKLQKTYQYSIPLEASKFSLKKTKNYKLGFTLGKKQQHVYINVNNSYLKNKKIKALNVSLSHGHIYYNFTYAEKKGLSKKRRNQKQKEAGLDIGVINIASILINDFNSKSLIIDGQSFIHYNSQFNRKLAKINKDISKEVFEYKKLKRMMKTIKIPNSYTERGIKLRHLKDNLFEKRKRYFDDQFNKLSKKILSYLKENNVNKLVLSKNLSFTKETGEIKMNKKTKQKFYQIPFGKLLNFIIQKSSSFNIDVIDIDEAYTSKTSCLSADVNHIQKQKKENPKLKFTSKDLKGSRGVKSRRGLFLDNVLDVIYNSDLNGAANHIKVGFPKIKISELRNHLWKVCNPIKVKSVSDFDKILSNSEAERKITLSKFDKTQSDDQVLSGI